MWLGGRLPRRDDAVADRRRDESSSAELSE
jgi:hypothetical protein